MPDQLTPDSNYQKGFNEGYIITKHLPELSDGLAQVKTETPRIEGFKDGRKQYVLEQTKEHRPSWMKFDRNEVQGKEQSRERNKEPEK